MTPALEGFCLGVFAGAMGLLFVEGCLMALVESVRGEGEE